MLSKFGLFLCAFLLVACQAPLPALTNQQEFNVQAKKRQSFNSANQTESPSEAILRLTNAERARAGVGALSQVSLLNQAAQKHADMMAKTETFSHVVNGVGLSERVNETGYSWIYAGENIALGYTVPQDVVNGWMDSEGHRTSLLSANFTEMGLGLAKGTKGETYWVQVFGRPK